VCGPRSLRRCVIGGARAPKAPHRPCAAACACNGHAADPSGVPRTSHPRRAQASDSKEWELRATEATGARAKLERTLKDTAARAEREARAAAEQRTRADSLDQQLSSYRRDAEGAQRDTKQRLADAKAKDVRLNRALEELERTKAALAQSQQDARAAQGGGSGVAERQQLAAENGRLRKQKAELLLAFKKQAKLIDILKRQKMHVEAARTLQFTEEEFSKTLRLGEQGST